MEVFYLFTFLLPRIHLCIHRSQLFNVVIWVLGAVVECLERGNGDRNGRGLKPTCAILLSSWERHFTALFLGNSSKI